MYIVYCPRMDINIGFSDRIHMAWAQNFQERPQLGASSTIRYTYMFYGGFKTPPPLLSTTIIGLRVHATLQSRYSRMFRKHFFFSAMYIADDFNL
jgi:hypothetical protein